LDSSERPIAEGVILAELGGIDRDSYRMMFSLDDDTLEAGGEGILSPTFRAWRLCIEQSRNVHATALISTATAASHSTSKGHYPGLDG
jgi:hypothetical protein